MPNVSDIHTLKFRSEIIFVWRVFLIKFETFRIYPLY